MPRALTFFFSFYEQYENYFSFLFISFALVTEASQNINIKPPYLANTPSDILFKIALYFENPFSTLGSLNHTATFSNEQTFLLFRCASLGNKFHLFREIANSTAFNVGPLLRVYQDDNITLHKFALDFHQYCEYAFRTYLYEETCFLKIVAKNFRIVALNWGKDGLGITPNITPESVNWD